MKNVHSFAWTLLGTRHAFNIVYADIGVSITFIPINIKLGYNTINTYLNCTPFILF